MYIYVCTYIDLYTPMFVHAGPETRRGGLMAVCTPTPSQKARLVGLILSIHPCWPRKLKIMVLFLLVHLDWSGKLDMLV